ncbi:MAG: PKD domain-containing protein, partial [Flavobacteriales bacterium]|nr:PKD domain-containing protein [Flavobacteriales bacterium]
NPGIPIITHFYDDTDQDGQWSIADQLLATDTFWNGLNFNDSIQLQFTFVSSNTQSCSVIGVIDNLFNPCICDPTEALIPIIPLFNTGPDSSICSMDSIKVGLTSQTGYNYSWSSLQYLSDSTISDPIFYYENQGTQNDTVQLILETNRGNCTTTDSLKIIVYPLPQVQIFGLDSEYCNDYGLDTIQGTPLGGNILGTGLLNDSIIDTKILGPGSFTYEYVYTDQNNCINRDSLSIIVYPNPTVLLQGLNVNYCVSSDNDTLVGTPVGGIFSGAGITDSIFDPQNAGIGNHLISYSYTDTNSCSSLDTQSVVVVGLPVTNILGLENSYCHKDEADTLIGVPAGGVFSGPGISGNIFQPQIADTGWHEIVYSYTDGNSCADSSNFFIRVNSDPVSDFSANNACMYDSIFFTNNSSIANGNIQVYLWDFGNTTSQSTNPSHLFSSDGIHQISLLATSDSGCTDIFQDSIEAYPIPISAFVVDSVCEGNFTHFVSNSSINYGTLQNHTYYLSTSDTLFNSNDSIVINAYGTYNTDLVVSSNQGCSDTSSLSFKVLENPSAEFIAQNVCVYDSMLFNENATINTGAIMNWNWSFGDGNSASLNPINHKYQTPGTYLVSLLVESTSGCKDSIKKTVAVHHVPQSSFTILDICEYDSLIPINNSSITFGNITNYNWDFGNGQTSTDSTDTVHYTSPGSYNIQLISVSDSGCADTINNALQVFEQPTANFTANFVCLNDTTFFQDLTVLNSGFIQSWIWNYAGNTNNNSSFWDIIDSTGTYDISLNVESNHGCLDSITRQIEVFAIPELDIDMKNVCTNDTLIINNTSFISDSSDMFWTWNFDDGSPIIHDSLPIHVYQSSDTFNVSVSALTVNGCAADTIIEIWSYPLPQALFEVDQLCLNDPATIFSDLSYVSSGQISSWLWDFGDGDTSQAQNTSHNYPTAGNYISTLIVASNFGCLDTFQTTLEINEPPIIWFEPDDSEICPNECVTINTNFTPYLSDSIYVLSWKYNDVSFGLNEFNPTICLSESDSYTLELVVITKNQCKDTLIRNSIITVHPSPIAGFEAIPEVTTILDPEINLIDTSKGTASWIWSFGNGTVSDIQMPVVNYEDTGSFMVEQIVQNNFGCTDTAYKEIIVGGDFVVYAPNAFTPDEDGLNDVFNIKGI